MKCSLAGTSITVPWVICFTNCVVGMRKLFRRLLCLSFACALIFRLLFDVTLFEFKLLSPVFESLFQLSLASILFSLPVHLDYNLVYGAYSARAPIPRVDRTSHEVKLPSPAVESSSQQPPASKMLVSPSSCA